MLYTHHFREDSTDFKILKDVLSSDFASANSIRHCDQVSEYFNLSHNGQEAKSRRKFNHPSLNHPKIQDISKSCLE